MAGALAEHPPLEETEEHEVLAAQRERLLPPGAELEIDAAQRPIIANHRGHRDEIHGWNLQIPVQAIVIQHPDLRYVLHLVLEGEISDRAPVEGMAGQLLRDLLR